VKRRIYRNLNNMPAFGIPLTGPDAIGSRFPVAGSYALPDGRHVLVAEGETCVLLTEHGLRLQPENIVRVSQR
jgi:hypothetical protein